MGQFEKNAFGLADTVGNVREWCADYYGAEVIGLGKENPEQKRPDKYGERVVRGGGWLSPPGDFRSAARDKVSPEDARPDLGFRVVMVPGR